MSRQLKKVRIKKNLVQVFKESSLSGKLHIIFCVSMLICALTLSICLIISAFNYNFLLGLLVLIFLFGGMCGLIAILMDTFEDELYTYKYVDED